MIAKGIEGGYQLESPTINGVFIVKLTLTDEGEERLETCTIKLEFCLPPQVLDPGTIEKVIGPKRWKHFLEMKEKGIEQMFIDPQAHRRRAHASKSW
ncbi:MAG: hypothetical protein RAO92_08205 [Candidatus Euphemobacter frigidus]|nr:hypothetical protein [Candidatus Euphemobacter frigidus]MDP8276370.1 hypothetical protein [Candidatus Euphemobacter frigidus]